MNREGRSGSRAALGASRAFGSEQASASRTDDAPPSDTEPSPSSSSRANRARRPQVTSACEACRSAKVKCTGKHPSCARCLERGISCVYSVAEEGLTRGQHIRRQVLEQGRMLEQMTTVFNALQTGSDHEASELLARLRMGESVEQLYASLQARHPSMPQSSSDALMLQDFNPPSVGLYPYQQEPMYTASESAFLSQQFMGGIPDGTLGSLAGQDDTAEDQVPDTLDPRLFE